MLEMKQLKQLNQLNLHWLEILEQYEQYILYSIESNAIFVLMLVTAALIFIVLVAWNIVPMCGNSIVQLY